MAAKMPVADAFVARSPLLLVASKELNVKSV